MESLEEIASRCSVEGLVVGGGFVAELYGERVEGSQGLVILGWVELMVGESVDEVAE